MKYINEINDFTGEVIDLKDSVKDGLEKFMTIKEDTNFKFGIILSTYKRVDGSTPSMLKDALNAVKNQTYTNYKIYLMGDDYEDDDEIKDLIDMFDDEHISYENLKLPGERLRFRSTDLWMSGSNFAANTGITKAISESCTHIVRLDHDDVWTSRHLEVFAKALTKWKDLKFLASTTLVRRLRTDGGSYLRPRPGVIKTIKYDNLSYIIDVSHSSMCWDAKEFENIPYRNVREQKLSEPVILLPTGADVDMLRRIKIHCVDNYKKWMIIPIVTVLYRNKKGEISDINTYDDERIVL